ncbi:alpha-ketoglutarate-dependent dioxygenase AlkB [Sphingobacterium multivorum]|uniref:alpha-ketoglutarate-dependent dioxygenase AlkB n=1 Tax=Sphingobacterium multivorum TaxID=28454 RepID=UPI0028AF7906|nr:alpha-ketoglutarate-dependent dioxygenase AlkB [Sphingobacterium multivorum]
MQEIFDLFNPFPNEFGQENDTDDAIVIPGLTYIGDFITKEEELFLLHMIDENEWLPDLKRRVQHYGWKYDYKKRGIDYSMFLGDLPNWIYPLAERLHTQGHTNDLSDQVIINEYKPGQGIANHVDCEPCFGDSITSISLGSTCIMNLINLETKEKLEVVLEPRSALIIKDESRYKWSHGIPSRLADTINNKYVKRKLRISMTFRKVIFE